MLIDFTGYAGDCLIRGRLDLRAGRLTDQLNADPEIHLTNVVLEDLQGGHSVAVPTFTVERKDLCVVHGVGPRGSRRLRIATKRRRLQAQIGPYTILGRVHTLPGTDAIRTLGTRAPLVPVTDATIAYVVAGMLEVRDAPTLIINRELASWLRDAEAEPRLLPPLVFSEHVRG